MPHTVDDVEGTTARPEPVSGSVSHLPRPPIPVAPVSVHSVSATPSKRSAARPASKPRLGTEPSSKSTPALPPPPAPRAKSVSQPSAPFPGIDPLQIPTPPELAGPIYGHMRRLALQADLQGADRILRDALADITSSLAVAIIYPGQDGLWSLGVDNEIPQDQTPIVAVARARRAIIASHTALVPIVTSMETVGVILLTRNPRQAGYAPAEQVAMIAMARESAPILHHLAVQHLQKQTEIKADKGSLYRGEALEAHRSRGQEGAPAHLSPLWVRVTYPILIASVILGVLASIFIKVPTYSSGIGVVWFEGTRVSSQVTSTVAAVLVQPHDSVKKGQPLVILSSQNEETAFAQADAANASALRTFLIDPADEQARKSLQQPEQQLATATRELGNRTIRAPVDGVVSDIRVRPSQAVNTGEHLLTLVDDNVQPEIMMLFPGQDRPRIHLGKEVQVALTGYTKGREKAVITQVGNEVISAQEAARVLGAEVVDVNKLQGTFTLVRARLPGRTFQTEHSTLWYHHGMDAKVELKLMDKPFLVTLLPALEKYIPD